MCCPNCAEASGLCRDCEEYLYGEREPMANDIHVYDFNADMREVMLRLSKEPELQTPNDASTEQEDYGDVSEHLK